MRHNPRPQEMYRHFKGGVYQIRCLAKHTETDETMVVYQAMYGDFEVYARPLPMFMEEVDQVKYPAAGQKYRFALMEDGKDAEEPAVNSRAVAEESAVTARSAVEEKPFEKTRPTETAAVSEPSVKEEIQQAEEQLNIDPLVLEFLDADSYRQRLSILDALHNRITDDMINMMAVSSDLEIKDGDVEDRYMELRNCLRTFEKYECNRLR